MQIKISKNDNITIESKQDKVTIGSTYDGDITIVGHHTYKNVDDIEFEVKLQELLTQFKEEDKGHRTEDGTPEKAVGILRNYVNSVQEVLRLDKTSILNAIIRNNTNRGWYRNVYQEYRFQKINDITELKSDIKTLERHICELTTQHEKEIIEWQRKVTEAKNITIIPQEVETYVEHDYNIGWVNCPFCDKYQDVSEHFDYEGGETNIECENCGKIFSVKCEEA